jgi:hypothetical protein
MCDTFRAILFLLRCKLHESCAYNSVALDGQIDGRAISLDIRIRAKHGLKSDPLGTQLHQDFARTVNAKHLHLNCWQTGVKT